MTKTKPGHYYGVTQAGRFEETTAARPDHVLCRRVADFPGGRVPTGATVSACTGCAAPIAWNPRGPYPDVPRLCMQCGGIAPLPIES
jgi:hypothetical protein